MVKKNKQLNLSGDLLLADFQSAFVAIATAQFANDQAQQSEHAIVSELHDLSSHAYLNPESINPVRQNDIGHASLNAHVMKVQATQLQQMSQEQLSQQQSQVSSSYVGRKVRVAALNSTESPFDAVWFNDRTGYRTNVYKKSVITGTITEIDLAKNLLVVKPSLFPRLINREFTAYFVYVIDPSSVQPAVEINFL
jgi:hypothetical protein